MCHSYGAERVTDTMDCGATTEFGSGVIRPISEPREAFQGVEGAQPTLQELQFNVWSCVMH